MSSAAHPQEVPVPGSPDQVLAAARAASRMEQAAGVAKLTAAVEWAALHEPTGTGDSAYWWEAGHMVPLAGEGASEIGEYAIAEFATALGVTTQSGRRFIGHALEIAWRLPKLWAQLQAGRVPAWRAVRVAEHTFTLSKEAAGFVDRHVAAVAGRVSLPQLEHLVLEARHRVEGLEREDPENPAPEVPDTRHMKVDAEQVSFTGTVEVHGELDLADALHLDQALVAGAEQLKLAGSAESLDARRATALGEMSRTQLALSFEQAGPSASSGTATTTTSPVRPVTLYLHLAADALTGANPVGRCENTRTPISTEAIRAWCGHPDAVVTVKPIIDLAGHVRVDQYELPDRLKELIDQRDGHCVFPCCTMSARGCDHDHAVPYDDSDPARGPTCSCNVAPLCRGHHRLKTHTPWRYQITEPGVYAWTTPHGYRLVVDHTGTRDLTPPDAVTTAACLRPVDPPDQ